MRTELPVMIVHHAGCWDGFGAAMVLAESLEASGQRVELIPCRYGAPPPDVVGSQVFVVDFSFSPAEMVLLAEEATMFTWLDHHKSAVEAMASVGWSADEVRTSMDKSGIRLAWEWAHGNQPSPWWVDYIEDRDLWRKQLEGNDEAAMWIRSHEMSAAGWAHITEATLDDALFEGGAMSLYHGRLVRNAAAQAVHVTIGGIPMPMVTCSYDLGSDVCDRLLSPTVPVAAYYLINSDGDHQYGFRSRADFDCSELAARFGGGGHAKAAGCTSAADAPLHRFV